MQSLQQQSQTLWAYSNPEKISKSQEMIRLCLQYGINNGFYIGGDQDMQWGDIQYLVIYTRDIQELNEQIIWKLKQKNIRHTYLISENSLILTRKQALIIFRQGNVIQDIDKNLLFLRDYHYIFSKINSIFHSNILLKMALYYKKSRQLINYNFSSKIHMTSTNIVNDFSNDIQTDLIKLQDWEYQVIFKIVQELNIPFILCDISALLFLIKKKKHIYVRKEKPILYLISNVHLQNIKITQLTNPITIIFQYDKGPNIIQKYKTTAYLSPHKICLDLIQSYIDTQEPQILQNYVMLMKSLQASDLTFDKKTSVI